MRRAALIGVSAAATLALGGALAACGGEGGKPYVAVDAAGSGPDATASGPVPPHGTVELVPLDGAGATGRATPGGPPASSGGGSTPTGATPGRATPDGKTGAHGGGGTGTPPGGPASGSRGSTGSGGAATGGSSGAGGPSSGGSGGDGDGDGGTSGGGSSSGTSNGGGAGRTSGGTGGTSGTGGTTGTGSPPTPTPATLTLGAPTRTPTPTRWCESVTVPLRNTGGTPVASGTLTFATHVIGLLGVDWATLTSTQPLAPVPAGAATSRTYTVCVDAWRVPLGMHIETRSVTADWR